MDQEIKMETAGELGIMLKKFEAEYLDIMLARKETIWNKFNGQFPTPDDSAYYNDLCAKCQFLENFVTSVRETIGIAGISGAAMEEYLRTIHNMKIDTQTGFRTKLFSEQKYAMDKITIRIKNIFAYVTECYK